MLVGIGHGYYWRKKVPPGVVLDGGGISLEALLALDRLLDGIYIPDKYVFLAVHGGYDAPQTLFGQSTTEFSREDQITAEELRALLTKYPFGCIIHDGNPRHLALSRSLRASVADFRIEELQPQRITETKEQFQERVRPYLRGIVKMGYTDRPPLLIAHPSVLRELETLFNGSAGRALVNKGGMIGIQYNQKLHNLSVKPLHRPFTTEKKDG